jgi:hypothetical protein
VQVATSLAANVSKDATWIIVACIVLIGIFVLAVAIWYYLGWRRKQDASSSSAVPWTFEDLRKLRDQGQLTEEEYKVLRTNMIEMYGRKAAIPERTERGKSPREEWDWVAGEDSGADGLK